MLSNIVGGCAKAPTSSRSSPRIIRARRRLRSTRLRGRRSTARPGQRKCRWDGGATVFSVPDADQLSGLVHDTGNETIGGVKTFSSIPAGPASDPTTSNQFTRKSYVDNLGISHSGFDKQIIAAGGSFSGSGSGSSNITGASFAIEAGETWAFEFECKGGSANTTLRVTGPASPTTVNTVTWGNDATIATATAFNTAGCAIANYGGIKGRIANGANAGTVQIVLYSGSGVQTVTSWTLKAWRIA